MRSFNFLNGSHIECIDTDNNATKRPSNACKPLTNRDKNDSLLFDASDLLSFISDKEKHFAETGHYTNSVTGTELTLFDDGLKFEDNNGSLNIKNNKDSLIRLIYTPTSITKDALDSIRLNRLDNPTLEIRMSDLESDAIEVDDKYIEHCKKLISKVYTNKSNANKSMVDANQIDTICKMLSEDNNKGEKEMTKSKPTPRNYTILPEIDDYKVYKDKQGREVAMVVTFTDGTKTKAMCNYEQGDKFDVQYGIAICYMRRLLGDVNAKKNDKNEKKPLGFKEYNRLMWKTIKKHEKKIKQAEREKERKENELKKKQELEAKLREENKKKKLEEFAPVIDAIKSINSKDVIDNPVDILKSMLFNDNK